MSWPSLEDTVTLAYTLSGPRDKNATWSAKSASSSCQEHVHCCSCHNPIYCNRKKKYQADPCKCVVVICLTATIHSLPCWRLIYQVNQFGGLVSYSILQDVSVKLIFSIIKRLVADSGCPALHPQDAGSQWREKRLHMSFKISWAAPFCIHWNVMMLWAKTFNNNPNVYKRPLSPSSSTYHTHTYSHMLVYTYTQTHKGPELTYLCGKTTASVRIFLWRPKIYCSSNGTCNSPRYMISVILFCCVHNLISNTDTCQSKSIADIMPGIIVDCGQHPYPS